MRDEFGIAALRRPAQVVGTVAVILPRGSHTRRYWPFRLLHVVTRKSSAVASQWLMIGRPTFTGARHVPAAAPRAEPIELEQTRGHQAHGWAESAATAWFPRSGHEDADAVGLVDG